MKTFVQSFQTLNNRSGGPHGVRRISNLRKSKSMAAVLESSGELTVLSCMQGTEVIMSKVNSKMSLRKSNKSAWVGTKQLRSFHNKKQTVCVMYSKRGVTRSDRHKTSGKRVFITLS